MEAELIKRLLTTPEATYNEIQKVAKPDRLFDELSVEYKWIIDYRNKHKKYPDITTYEKKFGALPKKVPEPTRFYIEALSERYSLDILEKAQRKLSDYIDAGDPSSALKMIQDVQAKLSSMSHSAVVMNLADPEALKDRLKQYDERRGQTGLLGIPCGWDAIDRETLGWQDTDLVYLVARMSSFKSWILFSWACSAWMHGSTPLLFTKEMRYQQIARRIDSYLAKTTFSWVRKGTMDDKLFQGFTKRLEAVYKSKHPFYVVDTSGDSGYDTQFIRDQLRKYKADIGCVDGTYLLDSDGDSETERQKNTSRRLKRITLDENIPLLATTQANRGGAGKKRQNIQMENIQYTDAYGQDGDIVFAFNRIIDSLTGKPTSTVKVDNLKMRDGNILPFHVEIDLDRMDFLQAAPDQEELLAEDEEPGAFTELPDQF